MLSVVEDILPLREFEYAFGALRAGHKVTYPVHYYPPLKPRSHELERNVELHSDWERENAESVKLEAAAYLRWRMARRHVPRMLCCGGTRFERFDDDSCKIRHADCEFGFLHQMLIISSGVYRARAGPVNERLYNAEGELIGMLTDIIKNPETGEETYKVEPMQYPVSVED